MTLRRAVLLVLVAAASVACGSSRAARPPRGSADLLDEGRRVFLTNEIAQALPYFEAAARTRPSDPTAHAWVAEAARRLDRADAAHRAARTALALDSCHAFAHSVLAALYNPQFGADARVSHDSTRAHSAAAVRCDPNDGNAWLAHWIVQMEQGDMAGAKAALAALDRSGFISPAWRSHARWVLSGLPAGTILLVGGDMDTYPVAIAQDVGGLRPDVAIVNVPLLNLTWYRAMLSTRYGVRMPDVDTTYSASGEGPADRVVAQWRAAAATGALERPLAAALTLGEAATTGAGVARLAGPVYLIEESGASKLSLVCTRSRMSCTSRS